MVATARGHLNLTLSLLETTVRHTSLPCPRLKPANISSSVIAGVLYGEETRVAGESFNRGTCTKGHGTAPRANPSLCDTYAPYLQSYCDSYDPDCCVGGLQPYNTQVHFSYPAKYDATATQFVKDRLAASGGA